LKRHRFRPAAQFLAAIGKRSMPGRLMSRVK
jgi:hypothetical protein